MSDNVNTVLRSQNAVALCVIIILALTWKIYEQQIEIDAKLTQISGEVMVIEHLVQDQGILEREGLRSSLFQTRNALYAVVPCDRTPGGKCPVTSEPSRRIELLVRLINELGASDLQGINLQGLDLRNVDLRGVNLSYAQLDYTDLSGKDLNSIDLRHASLIGANLSNSNLDKAILVGANLSGAGLEKTTLRLAQLQASNLRNVHACGAIFSGAKLGAAWLSDAVLWGADFSDTNTSADYRGAFVDDATTWDSDAPSGIIKQEADSKKGAIAIVNPSYGPEVAPFYGGRPMDGTLCPKY